MVFGPKERTGQRPTTHANACDRSMGPTNQIPERGGFCVRHMSNKTCDAISVSCGLCFPAQDAALSVVIFSDIAAATPPKLVIPLKTNNQRHLSGIDGLAFGGNGRSTPEQSILWRRGWEWRCYPSSSRTTFRLR